MRAAERVLVIDDEPDICWALQYALTRAGYEVDTATSGREALECIGRRRYDLALIDAKLLDMEGHELAELIVRRSPGTARLLISGYFYGQDEEVIRTHERRLFSGFIPKPFDLREVQNALRQAVAGRGTAR